MKQQTIVQRYGKLALYSVLALLITVGTLEFFDYQKTKIKEQASSHFDSMLKYAKEKQFDKAVLEANILVQDKNFAKTPYAGLAALMLAKTQVLQDKPTEAMESLRLAIRLGNKGPVQDIAKIRLARLLISEGQYQEALEVLPKETPVKDNKNAKAEDKKAEENIAKAEGSKEGEMGLEINAYATLIEEIRGDIYFKQNEFKKAKAAYAKAIKAAPPGIPTMPLQLKYTDLSVEEDA